MPIIIHLEGDPGRVPEDEVHVSALGGRCLGFGTGVGLGPLILFQGGADHHTPFLGFLDDGQRAAIEEFCGLGQADPPPTDEFQNILFGSGIQELP